jgi:hypothetical protein
MAAPFVRKPVVLPKLSDLAKEEKTPPLALLQPAASGPEPQQPEPPAPPPL